MASIVSKTFLMMMVFLMSPGLIRTAFTQTATEYNMTTPIAKPTSNESSNTTPSLSATSHGVIDVTLSTNGDAVAEDVSKRMHPVATTISGYWSSNDEEETTSEVLSSSEFNPATEFTDFDSGDSEWIWEPLSWQWDIILQLISAIVGILGNLLVIVVIFSRRSSGRTTDILIGSLAVADLLTSVAIVPYPTPIRVPHSWLGMLWCIVMYQNFPLWLPVTASSYILMAMSVERYIAVVYPLRFSRIVTFRRVNIVIILIWLLACLSLLFAFFVTGIDETYGFCTLTLTSRHELAAMGYYWFCLRIVVPVATMLITQSLIALELHRQSKNFRGNNNSTNSFHVVARNRVLKIMLEIIIIYIVCWLPNQVAFLGVIVGFIEWSEYIGTPLHRVLTVIGFYNSCLNPFIYAAQHPQFRRATKELFTGKINKKSSIFSTNKPDSSDNNRSRPKDPSVV
nr:allatostatin-A receptor-like [Lytechinus pictus]